MKVMKKSVVKIPKVTSDYSVSLDTLYGKHELKGNNLEEILSEIKPDVVRGKAFVIVHKGVFKSELILYPRQLKRMMLNKTFRAMTAKRLETMLK